MKPEKLVPTGSVVTATAWLTLAAFLVAPLSLVAPLAARAEHDARSQDAQATSQAPRKAQAETVAPVQAKNSATDPPAAFSATSHRRFDNVERWSKIFDDPERAEWQKPAEIVAALELKTGETVADLGAGTGYFLPYLTAAVGRDGVVYAVEVEPNLVTHLRERSQEAGWSQVIPVLASLDNARLPPRSVDLVLIVDTYHHLDDRSEYLRALTRVLSEHGKVAVVDWRKGDFPQGPPDPHKLARDQVAEEMRKVGYRLVAEPKILPYQYMMIFSPTGAIDRQRKLP